MREDGCGFLNNLFQNLNEISEQNRAEQAQCFDESEALELTNKIDGSKCKQSDVELRMLNEDNLEDKIYALYRTVKDKDYENLRFLVTGCKVDINHCFETENYIKVNYRGWRPVHFVCTNGDQRGLEAAVALGAHRGSTVGFLLLQCSSGVVRHTGDLRVSVATRSCRVFIFASS